MVLQYRGLVYPNLILLFYNYHHMDRFLTQIINKAKGLNQTIILPEVDDVRILKAASYILKHRISRLILIGSKDEITKKYWYLKLGNAQFIEPKNFSEIDSLANSYYQLRKHKDLSLDQAKIDIYNPLIFSLMLVKSKFADGLVAGASHNTPHILRPTLQIFKTDSIASSFFILTHKNNPYLFADCALNINPDIETLTKITLDSSRSYQNITGLTPKVALLSYSTHCTGQESCPLKIKRTLIEVQKINPELIIDGDIQVDAAINSKICEIKSPTSPLKGNANVLIFPDLSSANIAYKLVQQFTNCNAFGPILQGINGTVNDLSRGCTVNDIIGTICITSIQASQNFK